MYNKSSPNVSTTSLSDNDDDDITEMQSSLAPSYPADVAPAMWSSSHRRQRAQTPPHSPASRLPPELLIHILKQLHSTRDLHSALLVSRAWCECAVELLWHRPSLPDLARLVQMLTVICAEDQTFQYANFIRRLNFLSLGRELTDVLFTRLEKCTRLERLTLVNCTEITDEALYRVLPLCPNLVALDLTNIASASDKCIISFAEAATKLQGINLGGCKAITDAGVLALAKRCPLLRRIKLSGLRNITDRSVTALAKSCPLLLEIDLNGCTKVTDHSARELWTNLHHLRELRLAHCADLTDSAFPAPGTQQDPAPTGPHPFPLSQPLISEPLPPLRLARPFEHLRMLDLTACQLITDEAVEGIVTNAPKIRNLVLAKCSQLTDTAVESICKLGKHLHYLHLGHAGSITDRSVKTLARSCNRLRYIDLACCPLLTDMSVFELGSLPKLRRIGLVHVSNLTDQAIFSLADSHSALERIHLSYCEQITVLAVHFLLQRLTKLTHLSLTGIPAFRRPELQQFCRSPPREFNTSQRSAFCVYSGKGVNDLRKYLADLMESVQAEVDAGDNDTDYEGEGDEDDDQTGYLEDESEREPDGAGERFAEDVETVRNMLAPLGWEGIERGENIGHPMARGEVVVARPRPHRTHTNGHAPPASTYQQFVAQASGTGNVAPVRLRGPAVAGLPEQDTNPSSVRTTPSPPAQPGPDVGTPNANRTLHRPRVFGQDPIVEYNTAPTPAPAPQPQSSGSTQASPPPPFSRSNTSDVASNRSSGTNNSNGGGFFRTYAHANANNADNVSVSSRSNGTYTPDLVFAEIGHGRGANGNGHGRNGSGSGSGNGRDAGAVAGPGPSTVSNMIQQTHALEAIRPRPTYPCNRDDVVDSPASYFRPPVPAFDARNNMYTFPRTNGTSASASAGPNTRAPIHDTSANHASTWPIYEPPTPIPFSSSSSPTTRELQESVHSALVGSGSGSGVTSAASTSASAARSVPGLVYESSAEPEEQQQQHPSAGGGAGGGPDVRGRSMKRSLRSTLHAAENYASSFFFGGGAGGRGSSTSSSTSAPARDRLARPRGPTDPHAR